MNISRRIGAFVVLAAMTVLTACASPRTLVRLYDGPELPREQVVTLLYPTDIAMVLNIDDKTAGRSCLSGCDFRQPVQILAGKHRFSSFNFHMTPLPKDHVSNAVPADAAPLKSQGGGALSSSFTFDFEDTLEAGRTYALHYGHKPDANGNRIMFIWWNEMPNVPLT